MCDFSPAQKRPVHASHAAPAEQLGTSCSEISGGEMAYITARETLNTAISQHSTGSSAQHCFQIGSFPLTHARCLVLSVACFQSVLESVLVQWVHRRALWRMTEQMNRALASTCVPHGYGYWHPERHWNCVGLGSSVFILVLSQIHISSSNTI